MTRNCNDSHALWKSHKLATGCWICEPQSGGLNFRSFHAAERHRWCLRNQMFWSLGLQFSDLQRDMVDGRWKIPCHDNDEIAFREHKLNQGTNNKISIRNYYDDFYLLLQLKLWKFYVSFLSLSHSLSTSFHHFFPLYSKRSRGGERSAAWFEGTDELRSCSEPLHCLNVCNKMNCWVGFQWLSKKMFHKVLKAEREKLEWGEIWSGLKALQAECRWGNDESCGNCWLWRNVSWKASKNRLSISVKCVDSFSSSIDSFSSSFGVFSSSVDSFLS